MSRTWNRGYEANIVRNYLAASPEDIHAGLHWYQSARNEARLIADRHNVTLVEAAGVIAALSPGNEWGRNVIDADSLIAACVARHDLPVVGVYGTRNVDKARRILAGEWPLNVLPETGPKTRAFFYNILWPQGDAMVTIDRHAKAIAIGAPATRAGYASNNVLSAVKSPSEYEYIAWHYRVIAARYGLIPSQLQAISWVCWKRRNETRDDDTVPF